MDIDSNSLSHQEDFSEVLKHIRQSRQMIFSHINTGLIDLYGTLEK